MQKKIVIEIPDDLTEAQEAVVIAEKVGKKMLQIANSGTGRNKEVKRIGNQQVDAVKYATSEIEVRRIPPKQKLDPMISCHCSTLFNSKDGYIYYTNYGGSIRKNRCCSTDCRDLVLNNFPGRTALKKKDLQTIRVF